MSSPAFSLSLDEFPGILDVPPQSDKFLGEKVVDALREALEPHGFPYSNNETFLVYLCNELRHSFWVSGDERNSVAFADLILAVDPWDDYTYGVLSDWYLKVEPDNFSRTLWSKKALFVDPQKAVSIFLNKATRFRDLPSLHANCLKRVSEICEQHGLHDVARQLFFTWQDLHAPDYAELDWLPLPVRDSVMELPLPSPPFHPLTTPPEEIINAHNGWRDGRWNPITAQQESLLRPLLEQHDLHPWADTIVNLSQNCIRLEVAKQSGQLRQELGASRLGGVPDVPDGWIWPENLEFLAQFNLADLAPFDVNHVLPTNGLLRIFAGSIWCGDINQYQIEWDETPSAQLKRAACPSNYDIHNLDKPNGNRPVVYFPLPVVPCRVISLPDSSVLYDIYGTPDENPNIFENVYEIREELLPSHVWGWNHQLLGDYYDGQRDARYSSDHREGTNVEEWTLLFQIDSNAETGMMFSDAGTVYFMIRRDDLSARRFDRIFVTMTCG